jgi:hypothetical protein
VGKRKHNTHPVTCFFICLPYNAYSSLFLNPTPCLLVIGLTSFQTVEKVKINVFWDVQGDRPDDGGSNHLLNVGKLLPDNTAQQPRRQSPSYLPP